MIAPWLPLLEWWFGCAETPSEVAQAKGKLWFGKSNTQDAEALARFGNLVEQALAGGLTEWAESPHRNVILGRASTEQEIEFLKEAGSRF
jgi:uncharacterized protein (DUF924 family)